MQTVLYMYVLITEDYPVVCTLWSIDSIITQSQRGILKLCLFFTEQIEKDRMNKRRLSKHAESRARYPRDTSHVICLPHIRQNLTALMNRLCEKLQSHPWGCFGVGYPKRLGSKSTMKEACRVPASIASWPLRDIHPSRRHRPKWPG